MNDQIRVWTDTIFSFDDLPKELNDSFRNAFAEYELGNGGRLSVEEFDEYLVENGSTEERNIFQNFRMKNDIDYSYLIEFSW